MMQIFKKDGVRINVCTSENGIEFEIHQGDKIYTGFIDKGGVLPPSVGFDNCESVEADTLHATPANAQKEDGEEIS